MRGEKEGERDRERKGEREIRGEKERERERERKRERALLSQCLSVLPHFLLSHLPGGPCRSSFPIPPPP